MRTALTIATTLILVGLVACTVETKPEETETEAAEAELGSGTPPLPPRVSAYCGLYTAQEEYKAKFLEAWYTFSANRINAQQLAQGKKQQVVIPVGKSQLVSHPCAGKPGLVFYTPLNASPSDYVWSMAQEQCTNGTYQLTWSTDEAAVTVNITAKKVEPTSCATKPKFFWYNGEISASDAIGADGLTVGSGTSKIAKALAGVNRTPENYYNGFGDNRRIALNVTGTGGGKKYMLNWDPGGGESEGDPPPPDPSCWICSQWCYPGWGCWTWCWPC